VGIHEDRQLRLAIETEAGWLVLSHGVGPMRKYCLGAFLLSLKDPSRVIARLREPLLAPNEAEREGYVLTSFTPAGCCCTTANSLSPTP